MDFEKVFNDLESNQTHEYEEAKKKLVELFAQNKEQWPVHYMMEYIVKTGSSRVMEVLVKVKSPHDNHIFDRLAEWLKTQPLRVQALNLCCFVVQRHPTWLYKVEKHRLIKDILRLLLTEKEIVPLMSALLCIIMLLPIIPNLAPNFLRDLCDVFGRLATWNFNNRQPDDKLVHLQYGLQMLFHQLYGMYPCNFLMYLTGLIKRENGSVFQHTIKPLLESVRVHPMLVTATAESEISSARWKEMEPHDVVMECTRLSLPFVNMDQTSFELSKVNEVGYPRFVSDSRKDSATSTSKLHASYQFRDGQREHNTRFDCGANSGTSNSTIWSPYNEITTGPIPLTPTPSYMLPLSTQAAPMLSNSMMGVTGTSPPEAAVEATPETTPMKGLKQVQHDNTTVQNPHAVRAIFSISQPSSPMRKDYGSQFHFPETASGTATTYFAEHDMRRVAATTTYDRRLQKVKEDRSYSQEQSQFDALESEPPSLLARRHQNPIEEMELNANQSGATSDRRLQMVKLEHCTHSSLVRSGIHSPIHFSPLNSQCVAYELDGDMSCSTIAMPRATPMEQITKVCDECNETDGSLCTAGGLHIPTSRSMQLLARGINRRKRMTSYCYNDSSCEKVSAGAKADTFPTSDAIAKVRRTKSCSSITALVVAQRKMDGGAIVLADDDDADANAQFQSQNAVRRLQKSGKMLAIAFATRVAKSVVGDGGVALHVPCMTDSATQTIETVHAEPRDYEKLLYELMERNSANQMAASAQLARPEILETTAASRLESSYRGDQLKEQYQLVCLQLQYERYRREIHAERNRRLMGRSRDKRSLEMERDRLREQLKTFEAENRELVQTIDRTMKSSNERERAYVEELTAYKEKYQRELEENKRLRKVNEGMEKRLSTELSDRKVLRYELEALRGQIFNMDSELQHAQLRVDLGMQCKQELERLETEFIVMGEVQIKCRDRLAEIDNFRARDEELQMLQEAYNMEIKDLKHAMEEKTSYLDSMKHKIAELQAQLLNNEKIMTEQKRLLKAVKEEYEERFKALSKKYDVQKSIIVQMEEKIIMSLHKPSSGVGVPAACSPDTDKTDAASSMERNSPLSTSLASSESLSISLRSTELRNLHTLVETAVIAEAANSSGDAVVERARLAVPLDTASSTNTTTATATANAATTVINIATMASTSTSSGAGGATLAIFDIPAPSSGQTQSQLHMQQQKQQQQELEQRQQKR